MKLARRLDRRASLRKARSAAVKKQLRRGLLAERLEERSLLAADLTSFLASSTSPYWNGSLPSDVNADGVVAPNDALTILNMINAEGSHALSAPGEGESGPAAFVDVNNDGHLSPVDALTVINELNAEGDHVNPQLVSYTLKTINAAGAEISSVQQGQEFFLQMLAQDLRPALSNRPDGNDPGTSPDANIRGVYAAYMDVLYNTSLAAAAVGEVQTIRIDATSGTFTLTYPGQAPTAPITISANPDTTAADIAAKIGAVPGIGAVTVVAADPEYFVTYTNLPNQDAPEPTSNNPNVTVSETVAADPTDPAAFLAAITYAPTYTNGPDGRPAADRIDELGAFFSGNTNVGSGRGAVEILRVRMIANDLPTGTAQATVTFTPNFGTTSVANPAPNGMLRPNSDTLVMGNLDATPVELSCVGDNPDPTIIAQGCPFTDGHAIQATAVSLLITSGPVSTDNITQNINEDAGAQTFNVLTLGNSRLNPGSTGTIELKSVQSLSPAGAGTLGRAGNSATFTPTANFNGTATFTYTIGLVGNNNPDDTATATVTVNIAAVNDGPTNNLPSGAQSVQEDGTLTISTLSITDVDADAAAANAGVRVTLTGNNGTISLNGTAGLTFTAGTGTGDTAMTFTGLTTAVNTALAGMTFRPNADFSGSASIVINTNDQGNTGSGGPLQDTDTVSITVNAANDPPVNQIGTPPAPITAGASVIAIPDQPFSFTGADALSVRDPDAGATFTVNLSLGANQGTLSATAGSATVNGNNSANLQITGSKAAVDTALSTLIYTPPAGFTAQATLTMVSNDGQAQDSDTIAIDVIPPNKPFARGDARSIDEGAVAPLQIDVLANDLTNDPAVPTLESFSQPLAGAPGTVTRFDPGTPADLTDDELIYTPPGGDFNGTVQFTYIIDEEPATGSSGPSTATVTVTINPINDAPVGVADTFDAQVGQANTIAAPGVLANDTDVDDQTSALTAVNVVIAAGQGTVVLNANGGFVYTPPATTGTFTFTYQARDAAGATSAPTTVTMRVSGPASAVNDTATATEDGGPQSFPSVLANDDDGDPLQVIPLTATLVSNVPASAGTVVLNADGTFTYTPALNFNTTRPAGAPITFTYTANAGAKVSNVATVSITVTETNDPPTATNDTFTAVKRNGTIGVDQEVAVLGNDSILPDAEETITVTAVGTTAQAANGSSVRIEGGRILYTSPTVTANDSFTYTITDSRGLTATATVNVTVVDFVPKTVSGTVYVDSDDDGVIDSTERRLSGVQVRLTGVDFQDAAVDVTATTGIDGSYSFGNLKPPKAGTSYTLTQIQPVYLLSGKDTDASTNIDSVTSARVVTNASALDNLFSLRWSVTDGSGNISGLNFGERSVDLAALSDSSGFLSEFLASSGSNGFVMAVDLSGNVLWSWSLGGWANATSVDANLSSNLSSLTLTVLDGQNHTYTANLAQNYSIPGSTARFRILGIGSNGQYIIRIDGSANGGTDGMGMNLLAAAAGGAGEGEAPVDPAFAGSADAVFAGGAWA